ncbi:TPA: type II toxin-antitoxin system YafO family toxin [Salmonella enterica]
MIHVSVHPDIEFSDVAGKYADALQIWKNGGDLPPVFGNEGQWEESGRLRDSFVFKIHIRLPEEPEWPSRTPGAARKSNSYLVYSRHYLYPNRLQVISIMSPNAHEMARTSYMAEIERRAEEFQSASFD